MLLSRLCFLLFVLTARAGEAKQATDSSMVIVGIN